VGLTWNIIAPVIYLPSAPLAIKLAIIWPKPDQIAMPPTTSNTDKSAAGTTASAMGIRRPARQIIQRVNASPHRCTNPSMSKAPTRLKVARKRTEVYIPRSCS
jgi:hypothetical protein